MKHIYVKKIFMSISIIILLGITSTGCTKFFTIGENKGYCEENGCDYSDAGLCANPYDVFENRHTIKNEPYKNINCSSCSGVIKNRINLEESK
ncbi:MAG: hypothetical protein COB67_00250 [SAR324 cluster bacterium]|uniref:Lipoprotein n=1 Tax=SAR324 cluster bacterium TaxID=2024889 RepID=A0A2A4TBD4_9DELT|nr:MAG: hypothetical protein COB67_00250 [SAR324 cluster bacterium]